MSDTTVQECKCCEFETDCINGFCQSCFDYNHKSQNQVEDKPKLGMYGETPRIQIGKFEMCEFTLPPGDSLWIEETGEDAMQFTKTQFEPFLKQFYDKHF